MPKLLCPAIVFVDIDAPPGLAVEQRDRLAGVLEQMAAERITLVICSHHARAEVERTRQALGVFHPFVCENGAAAFVPERYFGSDPENTRLVGGYHAIEFAWPYQRVVDTLRRVAARLGLEVLPFSEMSVAEVARECGLPLLDARRAKLREYGEPFRLLSPSPVAERRLLKALAGAGLTCVARDGFLHAGSVSGPGAAAAALTTLYELAFGRILTAAMGGGRPWEGVASSADARIRMAGPDVSAAPVDWLERIVHEVRNIREVKRDDRMECEPAAGYAAAPFRGRAGDRGLQP